MIIFGSRTMHSVRETHVFHCPRCNTQREGNLKSVNRWFTLYFIPIIPLGSAGEFVECTACAGTWGTEVLGYDPAQDRRATLATVRHLLVLTLVTAGKTGPEYVRKLCDYSHSLGDDEASETLIAQEIGFAQQAQPSLIAFASSKANELNDQGKQLIAQSAAQLLGGGAPLMEQDAQVVRQLGGALLLSSGQLAAITTGEQRRLQ